MARIRLDCGHRLVQELSPQQRQWIDVCGPACGNQHRQPNHRASVPDVYYVEALNPALDLLASQLREAGIHNIASVVAPSLSARPELFEGAWYTDSNLRDLAFKRRFEDK